MATVKKGIILMNLGSPDSTSVKDVRKYLNEFLMDGRVIDIPYLSRLLLVRGIIVPFRAPKSAEAYKTIWTKEGSPLVVITKQLQSALQAQISEPVEIAMRYGGPTPEEAFNNLLKREPGIEEVVAVPLYPHYAMSSYETAVEHTKEAYNKNKYSFKLSFVPPFYNNADYINALAENMSRYLDIEYDHILFSYHGVPGRHIKKSDTTGCHCLQVENCCQTPSPAHATCYRHQCFTTTSLVTKQLNIPENKYSISFQSRLGKGWLEPFTDIRLAEMPKEGIKKLLILCPAFVSDCLETLEEIEERGKEIFINAGGESYKMIPCLNTNPMWVDTLKKMVTES
ncbi:ferrochelatase [Ferruginibacter lapsinanis]|uniref:ferrochelatase n=1 Tax=Ferruginibacter lapsinanis TaxID=563172 RepID=UPI001E32BFEC|nr:ferrochelatase [Ferruginibacter lapsinanis]UEG48983.1 ferrochelatase [Ferruginibacter lapsinanis]